MTNLYTPAEYKGRPDEYDYAALMEQAEYEHSWECLKPYPMLLAIWQGKKTHRDDVMPIARWVSHFRAPFMKPDFQRITVTVKPEKKLPYEITYCMGKELYGHELCAKDCGTHDYITGALIAEPLPF